MPVYSAVTCETLSLHAFQLRKGVKRRRTTKFTTLHTFPQGKALWKDVLLMLSIRGLHEPQDVVRIMQIFVSLPLSSLQLAISLFDISASLENRSYDHA